MSEINIQYLRDALERGQNIFRRVSVGKLFLVIDKLTADNARLTAELAELRDRTRWIPVSERLPENTGEVFIKAIGMKRPELGSYVYQGDEVFDIYCKPCFYAWRAGDWTDKVIVTHWMPLPEPPEDK
jgi:hypothetical protein